MTATLINCESESTGVTTAYKGMQAGVRGWKDFNTIAKKFIRCQYTILNCIRIEPMMVLVTPL